MGISHFLTISIEKTSIETLKSQNIIVDHHHKDVL